MVPGTTPDESPDVDLACESTGESASGGALLLTILAAAVQMRKKGSRR